MNRSCYTCKNINLCYIFKGVQKALEGTLLNIDGNDAPGRMTDVYNSLGKCCMKYEINS
jgi:hypothetical protein